MISDMSLDTPVLYHLLLNPGLLYTLNLLIAETYTQPGLPGN